MTDVKIMGQFADAAYRNDLVAENTFGFAPDYTIIATSHGNWSGYDGFAAFNPKECKVVVANERLLRASYSSHWVGHYSDQGGSGAHRLLSRGAST